MALLAGAGVMNGNLLAVTGLIKDYRIPSTLPWRSRKKRVLHGVDFCLAPGETLGLVGESGSGKSTTGRIVMGLTSASGGSVRLSGRELLGQGEAQWRAARRQIQMVFQDPAAALNPAMDLGATLVETLRAHHRGPSVADLRDKARFLLEQVGLNANMLSRRPSQCSGGQLQRVALARALAVEPELIVADEPVSALDVSVQAQVLNLMRDLQAERGLGMLFIAHDLAVVRQMSRRIAVMFQGRIVESGAAQDVVTNPAHPYTRQLIAAIPPRHPAQRSDDIALPPADDDNAPSACPYLAQCPMAWPVCRESVPDLRPVASGHMVACHLA